MLGFLFFLLVCAVALWLLVRGYHALNSLTDKTIERENARRRKPK
jgi:hypothetical protein